MKRLIRVSIALCLVFAVAQPVFAQAGGGKRNGFPMRAAGKKGQFQKRIGVLAGVGVSGSSVTLNFSSGDPISVPSAKLKVIDTRGGKRSEKNASALTAGLNVVVRMRVNAKGEVKQARVKIVG